MLVSLQVDLCNRLKKESVEKHLKSRLGELFSVEYDLLLYDVTSTYFEGEAAKNPQAQRGYSRDHRFDCKQICIGLVVTKDGLPAAHFEHMLAFSADGVSVLTNGK